MQWISWAKVLVLATGAYLLGGCAAGGRLSIVWADVDALPVYCGEGERRASLFPVEFTDHGKAGLPAQYRRLRDELESDSVDSGTIAILFVHGWRNDAQPTSSTFDGFCKTLGALQSVTDRRCGRGRWPRRSARRQWRGSLTICD